MPRHTFDSGSSDDWEDRHEGNRTVRFILRRSWVLIVPLIAVAWYNARHVVPMQKKLDQEIAQERVRGEAERTKTLTDARKVGVGISMLEALSDTFQVRFAAIDSLIDSVAVLRAQDEVDMKTLEAQGESLRTVYSMGSGKAESLANRLPAMQARIDSLKTLIASRNEQIQTLEAQKEKDLDMADRVLHPNSYRKNSALLTGKGDFPNRDALPER
jgi:hypothetical protein